MYKRQVQDGEAVCFTGDSTWTCGILAQKDCRVESLSFGRRVPLESYNLDTDYTAWRTGRIPGQMKCEETADRRIIRSREVVMPEFRMLDSFHLTGVYSMKGGCKKQKEESWWESDAYKERCGGKEMKRPAYECLLLEDEAFDGKVTDTVEPDGTPGYTPVSYTHLDVYKRQVCRL